MYLVFHLLLVILTVFHADAIPSVSYLPRLLVVSYDGFRYDYFKRNSTSFLKKLRVGGTYTDHMRNAFVTKTFPNHYTISTGMYEEHHGVVDSEFYDSRSNKIIKYSHELYHYNDEILPIWTLNEMAGKGRHSGVMMWSGAEFEYNGINATFRKPWNISVPWEKRVDELLSWYNHPETPINFGMLYIEEPDFHSHAIGIHGARFEGILQKLDNLTKYLHANLKKHNLSDINIVHLSDHGMSTVTLDRVVNLTDYINPSDYMSVGKSPVMSIYPHKGKENLIYNNLKRASKARKRFDVYLKKDIPKRYHYSNNPRIGSIIVVAKVGYAFQTLYDSIPWYEKQFNITVTKKSEFGSHGYDNNSKDMHPFFFGVGPAFRPKCEVRPFDNVDLVPVFCKILKIQCPRVNGTINSLKKCIK